MSDVAHPIPFPALTPAQRLHIEIYGYVIIENVLSQDDMIPIPILPKRCRMNTRLC